MIIYIQKEWSKIYEEKLEFRKVTLFNIYSDQKKLLSDLLLNIRYKVIAVMS